MNDKMEDAGSSVFASLVAEFRRTAADQADTNSLIRELLRSHESRQAKLESSLARIAEDVAAIGRVGEFLRQSTTRETVDQVYEFYADHQLGYLETLEHLVQTENSLARYGDGELRCMIKPEYGVPFQRNSPELMRALQTTLSSPIEGLTVGLPHLFRDRPWTAVWMELWAPMQRFLPRSAVFANSHVTRPMVFYFLRERAVELWRDVWRGRDVQIIAGKGSRFDEVPALFDSAHSISRVDSLPRDAFTDLDRLLKPGVLGHPDMFLIALGPAGTILARELHLRGIRSLDIGHLSASYLNVFEDRTWPEDIPNVRNAGV